VVSVGKDDGTQGKAHDEKGEGLQTIEIAQVIPPVEKPKESRLQQRGGAGKRAPAAANSVPLSFSCPGKKLCTETLRWVYSVGRRESMRRYVS
jgi:hypothetical protein